MALSNDIISQFVKATNDANSNKKDATTVYGTIVEYNGEKYVRLDGSDRLTPIVTTTDVNSDERVTVMIKNHTATVTGNLSSPAARTEDVKNISNQISEFEIVIADKVSSAELEVESGRIDNLEAENVTIKKQITANDAYISELTADNAEIKSKLTANEASIKTLEVDKLDAGAADLRYASINDLEVTNASIHTLETTFGDFEQTTTDKLTANDASIKALETQKLSVTDADVKYANIDFTNVGKAAMEYFYANSGLIRNAVIDNGTITGNLVGVTISGDLIEGNTIVAEKLVIKGEDGLYYKLNTDGISTEAEQTDYNSLNGTVIRAGSITAEKISVGDLVAFDATIGGFNITEHSIYSGVKDSANNTTRGIFLGDDAQIAVGDGNNYFKYYKDTDGSYKLAISAENIILSSSNKTVEDTIRDEVSQIEVGGRNLIENSSFSLNLDKWEKTGISEIIAKDGYNCLHFSGALDTTYNVKQSVIDKISMDEIGQSYSISADIKLENYIAGTTNPYVALYFDGTYDDATSSIGPELELSVYEGNGWIRVSRVIQFDKKVTSMNVGVCARDFTGDLYVKNYKMEKGNRVTGWTPAPEDMVTGDALSSVNNTLTESVNALQNNLDATNGTLLDVQNDQNDTIQIVSENSEQITNLIQQADGFTMDFKVINDVVNQLNDEFVTERETRYTYIRFVDGEIWLGKEVEEGEDDFKLVIKNNRISFMQNKSEVAYMSDNKLYVTDIHVTNSLRFGNFVWAARSNGNMGLKWIAE